MEDQRVTECLRATLAYVEKGRRPIAGLARTAVVDGVLDVSEERMAPVRAALATLNQVAVSFGYQDFVAFIDSPTYTPAAARLLINQAIVASQMPEAC